MSETRLERVGAVVIGRNEGERLDRCLRSLVARIAAVVYVDSRSTDGSVERAGDLRVEVVELDTSVPFTAARARNAGFERLVGCNPDVAFVQFVDGDCEVVTGWLETAVAELQARPDVAVVCGRRRERFPEASVYNRLCNIEWDTPTGETKACGGDATMRVDAFREITGYDPSLIAGEEPELCVRLRQCGWRILRVDAEMTLHDADMTRFSQWWKRTTRAGHAYAEGAWLHGRSGKRHYVRQTVSILFWACFLPAVVLALTWPTSGVSLALITAYPLQWWRIRGKEIRAGRAPRDARLVAAFTLLAKFAQLTGLCLFLKNRSLGRASRIIEYQHVPDGTSP